MLRNKSVSCNGHQTVLRTHVFQACGAENAQSSKISVTSDEKKRTNTLSSDEDVKIKKKTKVSKSGEKRKDVEKKRKKHAVIDSDSEDEKPVKLKRSPKVDQKKEQSHKKDPVQYVSETDSDSDNFQSLKNATKSKQNGIGKTEKVDNKLSAAKEGTISYGKTSNQEKTALKSPVTPKVAPAIKPKQTPTSVFDYFGSGAVQRSDKKLVASIKRKAPIDDTDDLSDEQIARQLQMDEDMELEKQVHEDEEFARTLAMLDEEPLSKKVCKEPADVSSKITTDYASGSNTSAIKRNRIESLSEDVIAPSPKKSPVKTSSKLAMMKKKDDHREMLKNKVTISPQKTISTKKEVPSPSPEKRSTTLISPKKMESTSTSPEDSEKKKANASAYRNYLNRDGPRALGSKEIPQGAENCLEGFVFVITGVLESMERDEPRHLLNVTAESFGTKILDEDGLFELIRTKPGKKSKYEIAAEAEYTQIQKISPSKGNSRSPQTPSPSKTSLSLAHSARVGLKSTPPGRGSGQTARRDLGLSSSTSPKHASLPSMFGEEASLLWVDKYKPRSLKTVIGQQGDQSCANKLMRWLKNWHKNNTGGSSKPTVAKFGKFGGGKEDGSAFKAALLSGPPGVGKTTTAVLVCEELGYSYVEMNASCTRSKNSLKEVVAESLNNTSIENFYKGTSEKVSSKHVLIMDEIDGMAGNEDRGGIQEMIGLIKTSKVPIICMCNDRNHQKIRSLANYCFDLRFQRPRVEQIKGAMMSIAFKEGIKIPPPALNEIILASNQDVRQVLHNLSMWSAKSKVMTYDQCKSDAANARKDMKLGPFDVCRKVFVSGEETARMSLIDKSDLFFHDYSLAPLFVQENYLHVRPAAAAGDLKSHLVLISKTADSICDGDLVDRMIRSRQNWSLLPTQAIYASVLPGELMRGYMGQFPTFPSWLGKNSSTSKHSRIVQELSSHMSLKTYSSRQSVNLDYLHYLRKALLNPLQRFGAEGAGQAVQLLDNYQLVKEDVDSMMEISVWGGQPDAYSKLDSKVKAAFTRAYNKEVHLTPYSLQVVKKSRRGGGGEPELGEDMETEVRESEDEGESLQTDAMTKQKKAKGTKETKNDKTEVSGKGKGRGKGKIKK
ncbi:hypothetical protein WMY93_005838 [Mugilogobius chulae]|uniref:Replication factor C subunit 1 n=1 Tax=Mugilogobius chulae TaxID=88201 RepID=A0AAW0PPC6_9GOBI